MTPDKPGLKPQLQSQIHHQMEHLPQLSPQQQHQQHQTILNTSLIPSSSQQYPSYTTPNPCYSNSQLNHLPTNTPYLNDSSSSSLQDINITQNIPASQPFINTNTISNNNLITINHNTLYNNQLNAHYNESLFFPPHQPPLYASSSPPNANSLLIPPPQQPSYTTVPSSSGYNQLPVPNSINGVPLSTLHQALNELTRSSLDIENIFNNTAAATDNHNDTNGKSSSNESDEILKHKILHGFETLVRIQHCYCSWSKSLNLNINDITKNSNSRHSTPNEHVNSDHVSSSKKHKLSPQPPHPLSASPSTPPTLCSSANTEYKRPKLDLSPVLPMSPRAKSFSMDSTANTLGSSLLSGLSTNTMPLNQNLLNSEKVENTTELGYHYNYNSDFSLHPSNHGTIMFHEATPYKKFNNNNINNDATHNTQSNNKKRTARSFPNLTPISVPSANNTKSAPLHTTENSLKVSTSSGLTKSSTATTLHQLSTCESTKCMHCLSTGTPEWRRGPDGERTLCNACGLFYSKLVKKYDRETAKNIMKERKLSGKCADRRISVS